MDWHLMVAVPGVLAFIASGALVVGDHFLLRNQHLAVAHSVRDLAATVAKMQADSHQPQRAANAPPVGAFSFKGVAK